MIYRILDFFANAYLWFGRRLSQIYINSWSQGKLGVTWFDHRFDHLRGPSYWYWYERGILANRLVPEDGEVLDLACGDGIFAGLFFTTRARQVIAVDRDIKSIRFARARYSSRNIKFVKADIREYLPSRKKFDVIILFQAIEHLSVKDGSLLLHNIAASLKNDGVLFGSTPILQIKGVSNPEHDNEFESVDLLKSFLEIHFNSVITWISHWPGRVECYFECRTPKKITDKVLRIKTDKYGERLKIIL